MLNVGSTSASSSTPPADVQPFIGGLIDKVKDTITDTFADIGGVAGGLIDTLGDAGEKAAVAAFHEALEAVGADPDKVIDFLQRTGGSIVEIIKNPDHYASDLYWAIFRGVAQFGELVGDGIGYLEGYAQWFADQLGMLGFQVPDNPFTAKGIFSMITQGFELSWDAFKTHVIEKYGRAAWQELQPYREEIQGLLSDPSALFDKITEKAGDAFDELVEQMQNVIVGL